MVKRGFKHMDDVAVVLTYGGNRKQRANAGNSIGGTDMKVYHGDILTVNAANEVVHYDKRLFA